MKPLTTTLVELQPYTWSQSGIRGGTVEVEMGLPHNAAVQPPRIAAADSGATSALETQFTVCTGTAALDRIDALQSRCEGSRRGGLDVGPLELLERLAVNGCGGWVQW